MALRRARGTLLRLVRRRAVTMAVGVASGARRHVWLRFGVLARMVGRADEPGDRERRVWRYLDGTRRTRGRIGLSENGLFRTASRLGSASARRASVSGSS